MNHHTDPLAELITAACAPPRPGAFPGEEKVVAAYRVARAAPKRRRSILARILTIKAGVIAGGVVLAGGVALAAGTGKLPAPLRDRIPGIPAPAPVSRTPQPTVDVPVGPGSIDTPADPDEGTPPPMATPIPEPGESKPQPAEPRTPSHPTGTPTPSHPTGPPGPPEEATEPPDPGGPPRH